MRTIEEVIAELRNDIHSDVYLGKKTINTYLDEILEIHKVERPQGNWILVDDVDDPLDQLHRYKCSECGRIIRVYNWPTFSDYPFCHCGADMRGNVKNETDN